MQNMYMGIILTRNFTQKWCANSTLEHILMEILKVLKPKQEDKATRDQVITELQEVVESVQSLRGNLYFHGSVKRILNFFFYILKICKTSMICN